MCMLASFLFYSFPFPFSFSSSSSPSLSSTKCTNLKMQEETHTHATCELLHTKPYSQQYNKGKHVCMLQASKQLVIAGDYIKITENKLLHISHA